MSKSPSFYAHFPVRPFEGSQDYLIKSICYKNLDFFPFWHPFCFYKRVNGAVVNGNFATRAVQKFKKWFLVLVPDEGLTSPGSIPLVFGLPPNPLRGQASPFLSQINFP